MDGRLRGILLIAAAKNTSPLKACFLIFVEIFLYRSLFSSFRLASLLLFVAQ